MRILYYGPAEGNSGSRLQGMRLLGHDVRQIFDDLPTGKAWRILNSLEWRVHNGPLAWKLNRKLINAAREFRPDIVWTEMGKLIYASTLRRIRRETDCLLVNSYTDDFMASGKRSHHFEKSIPLFDHLFVSRPANFEDARKLGASCVHMFWKGYNPELHFPERLTPFEQRRYGTDVAFVGHAEPSRFEPLSAIVEAGVDLKVWGNGWQKYSLPADLEPAVQFRGAENGEYRKALRGAKIGLQFLTRWGRDVHSSRSFEIPACGVFMLADRTDEHLACFEEGKEAEFYTGTEEMVDKIRFYLAKDQLRQRIAEAGYRRCITSGYSNHERVRHMLEVVTGQPQRFAPRVALARA